MHISNKQKLTDLLSKFNLENRQLKNIDDIDMVMDSHFDKTEINKILNGYKTAAHGYLNNTLK